MKQFPLIESVMTQVRFSESRLEKYFNKAEVDYKMLTDNISRRYENIACQSVRTIAKGYVQVVFADKKGGALVSVDVPTKAHFFVTGTRTYRQRYRMTFAASLS